MKEKLDKYIVTNLEKEIERLKENNQEMQIEMAKTWEDNDKFKNIINELEKYLEERIKSVPETMAEVYEDTNILNRLKTLKEGKYESN